jgi:small conductance mechanosensitive channel
MIIGLLVAISQVGIEIGPLLAGLGIAGFVIGFALQDSLSNFAAGAMILMYRPFDVGDVIEAAGVSGAVREMSLVSTTIHTFDNQTLIVPNTKLWGDVIRNVTAQRTRRIDLTVMTAYAEDVDRVDAVLRDIVSGHEKVLAAPTPLIEVHRLADSGVEFVVRPWVKTEDYWPTYWALTREIKRRFDREGISIPFPQRDVHHHYEDGAPPA